MPRVLPRSVCPIPICHVPARSERICCGSCRMAARINAQVSSAVAYDGVSAWRSDDTITPARVHASLADQSQLVETLEQRRSDLCPLPNQDQHLRVFEAFGERVGFLDMVS